MSKQTQNDKELIPLSERVLSIVCTTCFLIASKFDEIAEIVLLQLPARSVEKLMCLFSAPAIEPWLLSVDQTLVNV